MQHKLASGALAIVIITTAACGYGVIGEATGDDAGTDTGDAAALPGDDGNLAPPNTTGAGAGSGALTGLPCDVQQLLENRCVACHAGASPPALLTYENLLAKAPSDPTKTLAQMSLERMKSTTRAMPPPPAEAPDAEEIAVFDAWVKAGTPKAAVCTTMPDGGAPVPAPSLDGGAGPYDTPTVCTSKTTWDGGNQGSPNMRPGGACQTCHQQRGGPRFDIAGTVYATAHEPNDCNGKGPPPRLTIEATDKNGKVTEIPVNAAGNFFLRGRVVPPFTVKVKDGTKVRAMAGSLTAGDCNSCHTEKGANKAPGRVMAP